MQGFDSRLRKRGSHFGSIVPAKSAGFIEADCWTRDGVTVAAVENPSPRLDRNPSCSWRMPAELNSPVRPTQDENARNAAPRSRLAGLALRPEPG
jgi:hypothetical protein